MSFDLGLLYPFVGRSSQSNMKKIIYTPDAPNPVGPYNQAVLANGVLYVSGQIAINPQTGSLVTEDIEKQTHQVMRNLSAVLAAADMDFEHVLKCSVFVSDMALYSRINAVYSSYFEDLTAPARELVEVSNLPKFADVEISLIAQK